MFRFVRRFSIIRYILIISIGISFVSCAGRVANPAPMNMPGDNHLSKDGLMIMMSHVQSKITAKAPNANKTGSNVALGVAGAFLIIPWFFMDFSSADMIELNALRDRYNYLAILYNEKESSDAQIMQMPTYEQLKNDEALRESFAKQLEQMETSSETEEAALKQSKSREEKIQELKREIEELESLKEPK